jgi:hypothetical protein
VRNSSSTAPIKPGLNWQAKHWAWLDRRFSARPTATQRHRSARRSIRRTTIHHHHVQHVRSEISQPNVTTDEGQRQFFGRRDFRQSRNLAPTQPPPQTLRPFDCPQHMRILPSGSQRFDILRRQELRSTIALFERERNEDPDCRTLILHACYPSFAGLSISRTIAPTRRGSAIPCDDGKGCQRHIPAVA